ncbi:hypothetical protein CH063_03382 [Colletotrichum higginsianum]|uniref:Uncharacterized protein n=2 Tax=Colletotrichum higginsianum TaxID=80884 RepID=H1VWM3_COLHI|nr:hypothetical protein CH63R_00312 [Colletotrichum higginsianum IMI 349063]OBR15132.1 hypothetical protein CH63R_00312 [Colletotrichum higginsianum IMI 349063]TID04656.1 hypothetical protein CH35J_003042 [Colletotrichum higginsianum]CCF44635.1 hypothetical protein CH063_03382 [Colletotrichum higginsianum]
MATNTNTAALDAQNANTYQNVDAYQNPSVNSNVNPNANPATTQTTTQTTTTSQAPVTHPTSTAATSTIGGGDAPTTHSGGIGQQIKGAFAQGHGVGEVLRGKFNSAVDTAAGDPQGQAKNKNITTGGEREFATKDFVRKGTLDKAL